MNLKFESAPDLGFGCAPLLGRAGRKSSLRALSAAYDAGITFYDTARSYGYGEGEALLGEFLKGRRHRVLISTKFGIVPVKQQLWKRLAKPLVRGALMAVPAMRGMVRTQVNQQFQKGQFTVGVLRRSIEESLTQLKTDYVDVLFMHEAPASVLMQDDLLRELERLIQAGKVRAAGMSSNPDVIGVALRQRRPIITALQFPCNVFDLSVVRQITGGTSDGLLCVANHPFGGVMRVSKTRESLKAIAVSTDSPREIREKLENVDDRAIAEVVLNAIVAGTGVQIVVSSMIDQDHLRKNLEALKAPRFSRQEIFWLRNCLAQEGQPVSARAPRPL